MTKIKKILLAIGTIWPIFYVLSFFLFVISGIALSEMGVKMSISNHTGVLLVMIIASILHLGTGLWMFALLAIYIVNLLRNEVIDKDKKVIWVVSILALGPPAMLVYWFLYIWRDKKLSMKNT